MKWLKSNSIVILTSIVLGCLCSFLLIKGYVDDKLEGTKKEIVEIKNVFNKSEERDSINDFIIINKLDSLIFEIKSI